MAMKEDPPEACRPEPVAEYCRSIEAHLCRMNEGHLIRIVGPSFELVCGWAAKAIPLKVAYEGIDRCVERYHAKGNRRRPVQIEFCTADVLDAFDEWRRAVGLTGSTGSAGAMGSRASGSGSDGPTSAGTSDADEGARRRE